MKELFLTLEQILRAGRPAVLVTITASGGSSPRGAGARMLVTEEGLRAGTVGGGLLEHRCIQQARELLGGAGPVRQDFVLNQEVRGGLDMACGGQVQVLFTPIAAGDAVMLNLCRDAAARFASGEPFWLLIPLEEGAAPALWPRRPGGAAGDLPAEVTDGLPRHPVLREAEGRSWFCEPVQQPGMVYIFGGGHVAQALVPVLVPLDFPCVVLEDRPEFADPALFPGAREVRVADFARLEEQITVTRDDYLCIMTRGHQHDLLIQRQMLRTPARYIGVIGSARKAAAAAEKLRELGFSQSDLDRIVSPIGLPIGGDSPAEIALSIAAQLVQYRSGRAPV